MVKATKKKATATAKSVDKAAPAKSRAQKIAEANKLTFSMETPVRKFIAAAARAAGMDMNHYMQMIVENHVIDSAPADDPLAARLAAKRTVLARAVEIAQDIEGEGGFDENFILTVLKRASADAVFQTAYQTATTPDPENERANRRASVALNQQLGRVIKRAAGARSLRNEKGKIQRAQVQGEMIATYTLLKKAA